LKKQKGRKNTIPATSLSFDNLVIPIQKKIVNRKSREKQWKFNKTKKIFLSRIRIFLLNALFSAFELPAKPLATSFHIC